MENAARNVVLCLLAILLAACEPFPRDPDETTEMIEQTGTLRVGVIHSPPWTDVRTETPTGREVDLVKGFAQQLDARIEWQVLDSHDGFKALEKGDIDLLVGGLVQASPYRRKAAFTRPYDKSRSTRGEERRHHVLAARRGENRFLLKLENFLDEQFKQYPETSP